jgi:predicted N-acetyltransferase YhbS
VPTLTIRREAPADHRAAEVLTREAFWNRYQPGCDEHLLLHRMRDVPAFVPELTLVATEDDVLVGHVAITRARIEGDDGTDVGVLCLGPIAVAPDRQGQGIGTALLRAVLERARERGERAIVLFGDPAYYGRVGFRSAEAFGLRTSTDETLDAFQALELAEGSLAGVRGRVHLDPVFEVDPDELEAFDRGFEPKQKRVTDTQLT